MARTTLIEDVFAAYVAALPDVVSIAGGRVYPFAKVPQNADWPHVTYHRVSGGRVGSLRGRTTLLAHPRIQIDCFARSYDQAKLLADAIRLAIDGLGGDGPVTMGGMTVQAVIVDDDHDATADPMHGDEVAEPRVSMDAHVWFQEGN